VLLQVWISFVIKYFQRFSWIILTRSRVFFKWFWRLICKSSCFCAKCSLFGSLFLHHFIHYWWCFVLSRSRNVLNFLFSKPISFSKSCCETFIFMIIQFKASNIVISRVQTLFHIEFLFRKSRTLISKERLWIFLHIKYRMLVDINILSRTRQICFWFCIAWNVQILICGFALFQSFRKCTGYCLCSFMASSWFLAYSVNSRKKDAWTMILQCWHKVFLV